MVSLAGSRGTARWSCALSVTVENGVLLTVVVRTDLAGSNHDDEATRLGSLRVEWLRQMPTWSRRGSTCSPLADGASPCALARLTTMCSITARDHCAMGVQVSFMGVGVGSAGRQAWLWPLESIRTSSCPRRQAAFLHVRGHTARPSAADQLRRRGYQVIQQLPGIGPVLAAVIIARDR